MPDDCLKFKASEELFANNEMNRQDELKLAADNLDPFADVYRELGASKTGVDATHVPEQKIAGFDGSSDLSTNFTEGMEFDFF